MRRSSPESDSHGDMLVALLSHERDQQAVRSALPPEVAVHFVTRPACLAHRMARGQPTAVLLEIADTQDNSTLRALAAFHRHAATVPVCVYLTLRPDVVQEVMHLAVRGIVTDVIIPGTDNLRQRLRDLLRHAHVRDEEVALRRVWRMWTPPEARDIVTACMAASHGVASVADVARRLSRSPRTVERQVTQAGLPPVHRVLRWSRLLRAAHRLERPGANVKQVAAELGYPSSHALAQRLYRHTGLTLTELRTGGFGGLSAYVQARLLAARTGAANGGKSKRGLRRDGK